MIPLLTLAAFGASAAIIEVRNGSLQYRRLFKWKRIKGEDIIGANVVWGPVLASVRLKRKVFPWGRLYFVLDGSLSSPFQTGEYRLLNYIRDYKASKPDDRASAALRGPKPLPPVQKLFLAAIAGIVLNGLFRLLQRFALPYSPALHPGSPGSRGLEVFLSFKAQAIFTVLLICLALYRRRREEAWILAFLAGMGILNIALHWLSRFQ